MQDYLNNNIFPVYRKYLVFLEKPFIGKLESTNDKLENFFGNVLDNHTKRIYEGSEKFKFCEKSNTNIKINIEIQ